MMIGEIPWRRACSVTHTRVEYMWCRWNSGRLWEETSQMPCRGHRDARWNCIIPDQAHLGDPHNMDVFHNTSRLSELLRALKLTNVWQVFAAIARRYSPWFCICTLLTIATSQVTSHFCRFDLVPGVTAAIIPMP